MEWEDLEEGKSYDATITIIGTDRRGLLSDISKACENMDVNLSGVNARTGQGRHSEHDHPDIHFLHSGDGQDPESLKKRGRRVKGIQSQELEMRAVVQRVTDASVSVDDKVKRFHR